MNKVYRSGMDGDYIHYLKYGVKFIFEYFQEFERELVAKVGGSYSVKATIESVSNQIVVENCFLSIN